MARCLVLPELATTITWDQACLENLQCNHFAFMNPKVAVNRLYDRLQKQDIHHTIGRFKAVRQAYSFYQNKHQQPNADFYRSRLSPRDESLFAEISPEICAQELNKKSVSFGFQLPPSMIEQIHQFGCQALLREPGFEDEFCAGDVQEGLLRGKRPVLRGLVKNPTDCPAIEHIAQDPTLLQIVRNYLQYWPSQVTRHLTWTFISDLSEYQQKDAYNPLSYHYDVAGYNFMSAYFYITDVDAASGAHVMIEGSHNKKPWHTLFAPRSGRQTDQLVLDYYGTENENIIEGKAGFGFVQDPSCFHKLLPPRTTQRLLLQIRYA